MKKIYALFFIAVLSFEGNAQIANIPDANFKSALLNYVPAIDANGDNEIEITEALAINDLNIDGVLFSNVTGIEAFTNLTSLKLTNGHMSTLSISSLINLQYLDCSGNWLTELTMPALPNLTHIEFSRNQISTFDASPLVNLKELVCHWGNYLYSINISGLNALERLDCNRSNLTSLNVAGFTNLKYLDVFDNLLTSLDLTGLSSLTYLDCSCVLLTGIDVSNLTTLEHLRCRIGPQITALEVGNLTNLVTLDCSGNGLSALNVSNLTNLTSLSCHSNQLTELNVTPLVHLKALEFSFNTISAIDISTLTDLDTLSFHHNALTSINVSASPNLKYLICSGNQLTNLDVSMLNSLKSLQCGDNHISSLNVQNLPQLTELACGGNPLSELDLANNTHITNFNCGNTLITTLDVSTLIDVDEYGQSYMAFGYNPLLTNVNLKNGHLSHITSLNYSLGCPNLHFICTDEASISNVFSQLNQVDRENIQINSYCSFAPGGVSNTISGVVTLDLDANGCDASDYHHSGIKISVTDGTNSGATFTNSSGAYTFYTGAGNFTLTPVFENDDFVASPVSATLNFPSIGGSSQIQDFCPTPSGTHTDLEILFGNISPVRPGFNSDYTLVYKNIGNQSMSGSVTLDFNDAVLDFVSAIPNVNGQSADHLNWDFSNLHPFESRVIHVILNANAPTENPALNIGDILSLTAAVYPQSEDEMPSNNLFTLRQTVVGSYDPNDKTCLEGDFITPERIGDYLHYRIGFENSGTAVAENIVIKDIIDPEKFDIGSLQLVSSSHLHQTKITDNRVEFVFDGINLPAAINDEAGSHGFVAFKIKTKNSLMMGDSVSNTANIYFDYNFPVTTNTATTTVALLAKDTFEDKTISIFPNPVKNTLQITAKQNITSIELYDVQGRLIETNVANTINANFTMAENANGIYFIKIYTQNGVKVEKIIKE